METNKYSFGWEETMKESWMAAIQANLMRKVNAVYADRQATLRISAPSGTTGAIM